MSMRLDGIDLNSAADSIEANSEDGFNNFFKNDQLMKNYDDQGDVRGFSVDRDRESNGTFNVIGSVNEVLNDGKATVDRNESWGAESLSLNVLSDVKDKNNENKVGVIGDETHIDDRSLCLKLKGVNNDDDEMMRVRTPNQGMGINLLPQNAQAREKVDLLVDLNARQNFPVDLIYDTDHNGNGHNECLSVSDLSVSDGLSQSTSIIEARVNGTPMGLIKDEMFNESAGNIDGEDTKLVVLMPKVRGKENQTEKEGEYYVSDLVWGKVRSHPWWPGVICEPSSASKKAMEHLKKNSYLIAYFGDQTFAWNEASKIKPFHMCFSQMEKQSKGETFNYAVDGALDEVSRRIEFGLACPCLKDEVISSIDAQKVVSSGVEEQARRICGSDSFSTAGSFSPESFLNYVKLLAQAPNSAIDRLKYVKTRAQYSAFNRWKGYPQLRTFEQLHGILGNEEDPCESQTKGMIQGVSRWNADDQVLRSGKAWSPVQSSSQKRKNMTKDEQCKKKRKHIMELVHVGCPSLSNGEEKSNRKFLSGSSGQKRMGHNVSLYESTPKRRRRRRRGSLSQQAGSETYSAFVESQITSRTAVEHGGKSTNVSDSGVSPKGRLVFEVAPVDEMLSLLAIAAKNPIEGYTSLISIAGFFSDFRKSICVEYYNNQGGADNQKALNLCESETTGTSKFEGIEDSYWTDRIIESRLEEQDTENHKVATELALENQSRFVDDKPDEYQPTVLTLNFSHLESIPPITSLNEMFSRYGSLDVSKTEILSKTKRAKVVFKRRSDAETAYSSTGKFSMFGPALISYRLRYLSPTKKKKRKVKKSNIS